MARRKKHIPRGPLIASVTVLALFGIGWWLLHDANIPVLMPSGEIAEQQKDLIVFTIILSLIIILPVFAMLGIFAYKYREGNKKARYKPEWSHNNKLEIVWWGIPIAIIILLSIIVWFTSHSLDPYREIKSDKPTLEIQVVALQWKWLFIYPDQQMASVNDLTIPVDRPVHFRLSADAPMSAFWIPALGGQIYSMNAMTSQLNLIANQPGDYKGYNTNINGEGYAKMEFDVHAVSSQKFMHWHMKATDSGHGLDADYMTELSKPSVVEEPIYMSLVDKNVYESVIMKYMIGHGGESKHEDGGTGSGAPEPLDEAIDTDEPSVETGHMKHDGAGH